MTCDWPVDRSCLPALPDDADPGYDEAVARQSANEDIAIQVLWALSGRRFGVCPAVARPCPTPARNLFRERHSPTNLAYGFIPMFWGGSWRHFGCGCSGRCTVAGPRMVHLPGPVVEITEVVVGPDVLDPSEYTLEGDVLYRIGKSWPGQDLSKPMGEDGTWSVTYLRGEPVPPGVAGLTGMLAQEFIASCSGTKCRLPRNVTGVARNGVTYQVYNPMNIYASGKTGLSEVDLWLSAINPNHLMQGPKVR